MGDVAGNEALERLVDEYRDKVFRLACSLLDDETTAEDATQEIFGRIWRGLPGFRGQSSISTWIYAIARNTCLTRRRTATAHRTFSLDDARAGEIPAPEPARDGSGLRAAIHHLPANIATCWCCSTSKTGRTSRWR